MFIEEAAIRYVYKDFKSGIKPTLNDFVSLHKTWDDNYAEAPFCNSGDFDLDDLSNEAPKSWKISKSGNLDEGETRLAIIAINFNGERMFDLEQEDVEIDAFNLCGIYPLNAGDFQEEVFGEEWSSEEEFGEKIVLFMHKYKNLDCEEEILESSIDDIENSLKEWIQCIENPPTQKELDDKKELMQKLFG